MNPMQMTKNMVMNKLRQQSANNPMLGNVYTMAQRGDFQGIEQFARNICKEKNIDADQAINQIRQQLGMI